MEFDCAGCLGHPIEGGWTLGKITRNVAKSWKYLQNPMELMERKMLGKFGKGTRPISFGLEGVFTVKRNSVIKFYRAVIKGTLRALGVKMVIWENGIVTKKKSCFSSNPVI